MREVATEDLQGRPAPLRPSPGVNSEQLGDDVVAELVIDRTPASLLDICPQMVADGAVCRTAVDELVSVAKDKTIHAHLNPYHLLIDKGGRDELGANDLGRRRAASNVIVANVLCGNVYFTTEFPPKAAT